MRCIAAAQLSAARAKRNALPVLRGLGCMGCTSSKSWLEEGNRMPQVCHALQTIQKLYRPTSYTRLALCKTSCVSEEATRARLRRVRGLSYVPCAARGQHLQVHLLTLVSPSAPVRISMQGSRAPSSA